MYFPDVDLPLACGDAFVRVYRLPTELHGDQVTGQPIFVDERKFV